MKFDGLAVKLYTIKQPMNMDMNFDDYKDLVYKIVGAYNGSKAREITTDLIGLEQILNNLRANGILKGV